MKTHSHQVTVHWGDTDPAKIVFYPNYFAWFDQSTRLLFDAVGLDWDTLMTKYGIPGLPIVEANSRFLSPSRFRDVITIESSIGEWREKTFRVDHRVRNGERIAVEGWEMRVWSQPHPDDPKRLRAVPIPAEIRAAFD